MKVTILGCGGSGGVPLLGPHWGECNPDNPKNRRRRVSIALRQGGTTILVDTSPDLRAQCLDAGISQVSAILYTHDHADHTQGIDDARFLKKPAGQATIPVYGTSATLKVLAERFQYIFQQNTEGSGHLYKPFLRVIELAGPFEIDGIPVVAFEQDHGFGSTSTGYRIGNVAYCTDVARLSDEALAKLRGLDLFVVDCLRYEAHPTHAHFDQALAWAAQLEPKHTVLTHMNHLVDYDVIKSKCPPSVEPGYDGLEIEVPDA
ncbi:MBL fold metallo-hydrolase [Dongia deserti]|uniref:MBL fold metallo-hydrolase n=1 Tax=Dongia deserti TaxID=2268030 RepID=UPI000E64661D|nr:MBL fold metallo-hydrolase [Dongia deserti]